ncbi:Hypothetical predicted protein [Paramuricea clavata]|uniref:Uncharacterized protein n=1 Tax=Paramuricea clavata TaxID=317549 RepID=A0A6S7IF75_PARCT|nr:Hypothetical predicted protein [Paramuricea clavata]
MKTAVVLMVFAVLLATSFVHESDAFAAGGGSFGKKRTLKNQKLSAEDGLNYMCKQASEICRRYALDQREGLHK